MDQEVATQMFRFLVKDIKLEDFEQWCYSSVSLENSLDSDDYLALVMVNFKADGARYEVKRILAKYISETE